jgi:hypothetical protein
MGGALLLALMAGVTVVAPPTVWAADEEAQVLPGGASAAVAVDVDGDGARDVVRLIGLAAQSPRVDAWGYETDGWSLIGASNPIPHVSAPEEDVLVNREVDVGSLLVWHIDGIERVLVVVARSRPSSQMTPDGSVCCLSLFDLRPVGDDIELRSLSHEGVSGQAVQVMDIDGDGTDELAVSATAQDVADNRLDLLRWNGTAFEIAATFTGPDVGWGVWTGDSDGLAGEDVLFGPTVDGELRRVTWANGAAQVERARILASEPFQGWVAGMADGRIVVQMEREIQVLRWPRHEAPQVETRMGATDFPWVSVLGEGGQALIVMVDGNFGLPGGDSPTAVVYDLALQRLGQVRPSAGAARLWDLAQGAFIGQSNVSGGAYPAIGPLMGTTADGRPGFISAGNLIQPSRAGYEARSVASLPGMQVLGAAGPSADWMVLVRGWVAEPNSAYLFPRGSDVAELSVAPAADVLRPDGQALPDALELRNAVEQNVGYGVADRPLLAAGDGFSVAVEAPAGSRVVASNGFVAHDYQVEAEPLVVEFAAPRKSKVDENQPVDATLFLVTPDGRASFVTWSGTYLRERPEVSIAGRTQPMALSATLIGDTSMGASVTVDGRPVTPKPDGSFTTTVDAPIWPRQVLVVASDPFGHETVTHIEVVGILDYRGFPWAVVIVAATIGVGGALFVRTPRRRSPAMAVPRLGDGRLEELELEDLEELARAYPRRR